ncbi:MAG TPA: hypothetical protein VIL49_03830 [Capillimicrobium sp.]|jgi:hypothetical protein
MARSRLPFVGALVALALLVAAAVAVALAVSGDGSGGGVEREEPSFSATQPPPPGGTEDAAVIEAWSATLAAGDVREASAYFHRPALVQTDPRGPAVRLATGAEVRAFNAGLPCGAKLLDSAPHGRYTIATFRLLERPGARCDAPGATASTAFLIRDGRIAEWRRVPSVDPAHGSGSAPVV